MSEKPGPSARATVFRRVLPAVTALAFGVIGAELFVWLAFPLPWLLGSIFAGVVAGHIPNLRIAPPSVLTHPVRLILGITVGSAFTPALVDEVGGYLLSLAMMVPFLLIIVPLGTLYYERVMRFERRTAFFSALPGGLVEMILLSETFGADIRRVALTQTTRVLLIVYTVPFLISWIGGVDLSGRTRVTAPFMETPIPDMLILAVAAFVGWRLLQRLKVSGASIIGPMITGAIVYMLGWVTARVPDELIWFAQLVLGTGIGCAFAGISFKLMARSIVSTLGFFIVLMGVALAIAYAVHLMIDVPLIAAILAFIPGGQAEMNLMAIIVGVHVPYIALHHVLRMFLVITVMPLMARRLMPRGGQASV
jgi:uncharacterized protein